MEETSFNYNENDMMLAIAAATATINLNDAPIVREPKKSTSISDYDQYEDPDRLQVLEEEQELLNNSLMALTTHFAQVQFRLRQIVNAPNEHKEVIIIIIFGSID